MAIKTLTYIKSKFKKGMKPTEQDFVDVFDTLAYRLNHTWPHEQSYDWVELDVNVETTWQQEIVLEELPTDIDSFEFVVEWITTEKGVEYSIDTENKKIIWNNVDYQLEPDDDIKVRYTLIN